jgi:hypothetical protein
MVRRRHKKESDREPIDLLSLDSDNEDAPLFNLKSDDESNQKVNVAPFSQVNRSSHASSKVESSSSGTVLVTWDGCAEDTLLHLSSDSEKSPSPLHDSDGTTAAAPGSSAAITSIHQEPYVPRFTRSDRTDILTFIIEENEKLKQKSQLLNGWFKKITSRAKKSVLRQTSPFAFTTGADSDHEEEEDEDEEDDWEQVQNLNSTAHQKRQELSLLITNQSSSSSPSPNKESVFSRLFSGFSRSSNRSSYRHKSNVNRHVDRQLLSSNCLADSDPDEADDDQMFMQLTELPGRTSDDDLSYTSGTAPSDLMLPHSKCLTNFSYDSDPNGFSFKTKKSGRLEQNESRLAILLQVFFPFFIAGFGTVGAGLVLDYVQVRIIILSICFFFYWFY